jgi:hypothetical protein
VATTPISFFDMSVSITPPGGHLEPQPLTLGPNWQPNDIRMAFVAAAGSSGDITLTVPMTPDPPTTFTTAFSINPGHETNGAYYRRLVTGNTDSSFAIYKPQQWQYFMYGLLTARGISPTSTPTAGRLKVAYTAGVSTATVTSVTVPAAGTMVFFIGTVPDPAGSWPSWAVSMGAPTGWTNLVATAKSGSTFYAYDDNPGLLIAAKNYTSSGSTGSVSVPVSLGQPAFLGMYMFLQPAADVSASIGAA